jgi:hypothetical protein
MPRAMNRPLQTMPRLLCGLLLGAAAACTEQPATPGELAAVDGDLRQVEQRLRGGQLDACLAYIDLCERASGLCLRLDEPLLCDDILSRCAIHSDSFCGSSHADGGDRPWADAGPSRDAVGANGRARDRGVAARDAARPRPDGAAARDSGAAPDQRPNANCVAHLWSNLEACGWPGPGNTGPAAGVALKAASGRTIRTDNTVISGELITGALVVAARNVTIRDSRLRHDGGGVGGSGVIKILAGASATIERVEIDGLNHTHACIWHEGAQLVARYVDCHGINDGIFSWADTGSADSGDNFTIEHSYFHDFTTNAANGHIDGYQAEGAKHGLIRHNTYRMTASASSAIAIWNGQKDTSDILVEGNLLAGGGATIYAEDYSPREEAPVGGYTLTGVVFKNNSFSTLNGANPCVGAYFVWFSRPQYAYGGGPTDGWHRSGNLVLETGENIDQGNPHVNGQLCR